MTLEPVSKLRRDLDRCIGEPPRNLTAIEEVREMCPWNRRSLQCARIKLHICCLVICASATLTAEGAVRTIAYTGQKPYVTDEDVSFDSLAIPSLNNRGDVVFTASLAGKGVSSANDTSLWFGANGGSLQAIVREGTTGAGLPEGASFGPFTNTFVSGAALNDAGQYTFAAPIAMPDGKTRTAILAGESQRPLNRLALSGAAAPGVLDEATYYISPSLRPSINRQGLVAFPAQLSGVYAQPANNGADGIWRGPFDGIVTPAILIKEPAPGIENNAKFVDLWSAEKSVLIDGNGTMVFHGVYGLANGDRWDGHGIWLVSDTKVELAASSLHPWPELGPDAVVNSGLHVNGLDTSGRVVFVGNYSQSLIGPGWGQYIGAVGSDELEVAAFVGGAVPGASADIEFGTLYDQPVMSSGGDIAFFGSVWNRALNSRPATGVWSGEIDDLGMVASEAAPTPGLDASFGAFVGGRLSINRFGQIAFPNILTGADSGSSLWATDLAGNLVLVARAGETIEVAPGDGRVIESLEMTVNHGDDDGRARGLNDRGEVAFLARFTDGSSGVLVSDAAAVLPGDYDANGVVDAADYTVWRDAVASQDLRADGDRSGAVDEQDFLLWREFYGFSRDVTGSAAMQPLPEPSGLALIAVGAMLWSGWRRRRYTGRTNSDGRVTEK